jgi:hypothetical protein
MVARDYELLTLREVRVPSTPAYICLPEYHYTAAEQVFRINWQHRADSLGPWDARTMASLNNWITTLIKLKKYGEAAKACRAALNTLKDPDESPYFIIMKCNLAACLVLSKQKEEASKLLDYLRQRHMLVRFDIAAQAYFEALSMTCRTGRDCMVLRESDDRVPGMVRIYNYTTQGNDRNTIEGERKSHLDQDNLPSRSDNIFSARLSKTINSHTVQHCLRSLRRTTSLLWRSSQVNQLTSTAVSLETDVPQEADARLNSFIASTSPAIRKSLAALVDAFELKVDQHATEQQVAENSSTIVRPDTPRPPVTQADPRPPVTQSPPESQVFRAYTGPPLDQKLLESRVSQTAPNPQGTKMSASGPSHGPTQIQMEATLKPRVGVPMFVQTPKQHDKQLVSSTTVIPVQKPQATDGSSKVKAWLEHQKANLPIPGMFPTADPPPSPTDAMIGLTHRTNDTIGSSVSLSTFAFDLVNLIHDYSKSPTSSPRTCFQLLCGQVAALSRSR